MRLVTYRSPDQDPRAGLLVDGSIIEAQACAAAVGLDGATDWASVRSIIATADEDALRALDEAGRRLAKDEGIPQAYATLLPPVPDPEKVLCIGLNYRDHVEEAQAGVDPSLGTQKDPVVFSKFNSALIGDGAEVVLPAAAPDMVDWEGELAVVIGRRCERVAAAEALDHVFGYMVLNDVSARDLQMASPQWLMGKSFDTSGPCGPALVTKDEVADPQRLRLTTHVNGELMQDTSTALMINPITRLIEYISSLITLEPGDVIATGTPAGVGFALDPKVFLRHGDEVTVTVEGVGTLTNGVRAA